jgi:signal transduction histidine kinase
MQSESAFDNAPRRVSPSARSTRSLRKADVRAHSEMLIAFDGNTLAILVASEPALARYKCSRREFLRLNLQDIQAGEERLELCAQLTNPQSIICDHGLWRQRDRQGGSFAALLISRDMSKGTRDARALLVHEVRTEQSALEDSLSRCGAGIADAACLELTLLRWGVQSIDQALRATHLQAQELYLHQYATASRGKASTLTRLVLGVEQSARALHPLARLAAIAQTGINRQRLDLSALVSSLLMQTLQSGEHRSVESKVQPNLIVNADAALLSEALAFVIDSSIRSTRTRSVASIQFGCAALADQMVFFIRDNGIGLNADHVRAVSAGSSCMRGLEIDEDVSLALLAVELIFTHHGGRMWIDSVADVGTTFYFTLPN